MNLTPSYLIDVGGGVTAQAPLSRRLSRQDMEEVEIAMAACFDGLDHVGREVIGGFERRLGLTSHDRVGAELGHDVIAGAFVPLAGVGDRLDRLRLALVDRGVRQLAPAASLETREAEVWREAQLSALAHVEDRLAQEDVKAKAARRIGALKKRRKVQQQISDRKAVLNMRRAVIVQAIEQRDEEAWREARRAEVAALEVLRGGVVEIVEREVVTPLIKEGSEVWRRGKQTMVRERISAPVILTRDGLQTLSTAHLKADGEPRMQDGVAMTPLFDPNQLAALERYRIDFEAGDPDWSLKAVDTSAVGGDRQAFDPARSMVDVTIYNKAKAVGRLKDLDLAVRKHAGQDALIVLRAVAGVGHTIRSLAPGRRKAIRLTRALIAAADILADEYGLH